MQPIANLHDLFSDLPQEVQDEIQRVSIRRIFRAGEIIYTKGDVAEEMYQVISGAVRMCTFSFDGKQYILGDFREGDCFGDMGLIDNMPRVNSTVAVRDCEILVLPALHFRRIYKNNPEMSQAINLRLARQLRLILNMHEEISSQPLRDRVINLIERLVYSHGAEQSEGGFLISVSQEEIAHMLGATRQSISREIKRLEQEKMVVIGYKTILVPDPAALRIYNQEDIDVTRVVSTYNQTNG